MSEYLDFLQKAKKSTESNIKTKKAQAKAIALFCNLINPLGINTKDEAKTVENYCKRIWSRKNIFFGGFKPMHHFLF